MMQKLQQMQQMQQKEHVYLHVFFKKFIYFSVIYKFAATRFSALDWQRGSHLYKTQLRLIYSLSCNKLECRQWIYR